MEPQSRGQRDEDQLQGVAVQDQAVRPLSPWQLEPFVSGTGGATEDMLVVQFPDRLIRCFAERRQWTAIDLSGFNSIQVRLENSQQAETLSLQSAKAIFFVKSFEGAPTHEDLRFHDEVTPPDLVWVRLTFLDGEIMECMLDNTRDLALRPSFFVKPVDPDSNNWLVHVFKSNLQDFQILALRSASKS